MKMSTTVQLLRWANAIEQEERELRVWMNSTQETSRVMKCIDLAEVSPELVVPLLKSYKARHLSTDALPESFARALITHLADWSVLPAAVTMIPSNWHDNRIQPKEFATIALTLDEHYSRVTDDLNGENWIQNSMAVIKAVVALEVHVRRIEQESHVAYGGKGFVRPDVGNLRISEDTAKFVMDHPEHAEEVIEIMINRGTRDFELIDLMINSDTKALSEGSL